MSVIILITLMTLSPKIAREGISYKFNGIGAFQGMVPGGAEGGTQTPLLPLPWILRKISLHPIHKEQMLELRSGHQERQNFLGFGKKELEIFLFLRFLLTIYPK